MALAAGSRIGAFEIIAPLGAGGMGEVYRARDARLNREVAIKILPAAFAADTERLTRFEREAKTLAALNHPHIAHLYGFEQADALSAIVMEFVDGDDLSRRLMRGVMPVEETLAIARQIADGLEAAHEQGIVHRDLKPSNIKVRSDGVVKLLDFGLAKALERQEPTSGRSQSPTETAEGTRAGVVLGTAAYMSPEQARGKPVDKRTDVWAFGCVLYEMLTGRMAFGGETASDILARVLERDPDWTRLPADTPARVRLLLRRCLEKDARRRLRDIGDARLELAEQADLTLAPVSALTSTRWRLMGTFAALMAGLAVAFAVLWLRAVPAAPQPVVFAFTAPTAVTAAADGILSPVPSPDGRLLAFVARGDDGRSAVWLRRIDSTAARAIDGTAGTVSRVFWSPDGRFIGFYADGRLKKADVSGGPVVTICASPGNLGASWGADNTIVFAPINRSPLNRVSASGGTPQPITTLNQDRRENSHRFPSFLPDGRRFLFTARSDVKENNLIYVGSLDSSEVTPVVAAQSQARYVPPGYLLFARDGTLMLQPFDLKTASLAGDPVPLIAGINHNTPSSSAGFAVSANGSVLIHEGGVSSPRELVWYSREGVREASVAQRNEFTDIQIAPDERLAATVIPDSDSGNRDIWILSLATESLTRLTSNPANDWQPAWSPDSRQIAFATDRHGRSTVYSMPVDGGDEQLLLRLPDQGAFPTDWSADGRFLTLGIDSAAGVPSLWALPLGRDRTPFLLNRPASPITRENEARLSPDGQWLAYQSNESGTVEIYVKPFSRPGKVRVSTTGGTAPRWRGDGRELFYREPGGEVMAVAVQPREPFAASHAIRLFAGCERAPNRANALSPPYDVTKDGKRFLMVCPSADADVPPVTVSVNWTTNLRR